MFINRAKNIKWFNKRKASDLFNEKSVGEKIGCFQIHHEVLEEVPSCVVWLKPEKRTI